MWSGRGPHPASAAATWRPRLLSSKQPSSTRPSPPSPKSSHASSSSSSAQDSHQLIPRVESAIETPVTDRISSSSSETDSSDSDRPTSTTRMNLKRMKMELKKTKKMLQMYQEKEALRKAAKRPRQRTRDAAEVGKTRRCEKGPSPGARKGEDDDYDSDDEPLLGPEDERALREELENMEYGDIADELKAALLGFGWAPEEHYTIQEISSEENEQLKISCKRFKILPLNLNLETQVYDEIYAKIISILESALRRMCSRVGEDSWGQLRVMNPGLYSGAFSTLIKPLAELDMTRVLSQLCAALQSDETVALEESVFELVFFAPPSSERHQSRKKWREWRSRNPRNRTRRGQPVPGLFGGPSYHAGLCNRAQLESKIWLKTRRSLHCPLKYVSKRSQKTKKNLENFCAPLSLVDAKMFAFNPKLNMSAWIKWQANKDARTQEALKFAFQSGAPLNRINGPFTEKEVVQMARYLTREDPRVQVSLFTSFSPAPPEYQITADGIQRNPKDGRKGGDPPVCLDILMVHGHCWVIKNLACFIGGETVCRRCWKACRHNHTCQLASCHHCCKPACTNTRDSWTDRRVKCPTCLANFRTPACFDAHFSVINCQDRTRCDLCNDLFLAADSGTHTCSLKPCPECGEVHGPGEFCFVSGNDGDEEAAQEFQLRAAGENDEEDEALTAYLGDEDEEGLRRAYITPEQSSPSQSPDKAVKESGGGELESIWAADIECEISPAPDSVHLPMLLMLYRERRGKKKLIKYTTTRHSSCIRQFIGDLISEDSIFQDSTILFHFGSKYDALFIWVEAMKEKIKLDPIFRGGQLLCLTHVRNNIRIVDSYLHLNLALEKFPSAFGLQHIGSKGHWPYKIGIRRYLFGEGGGETGNEYEEPGLPPFELYSAESKKGRGREELRVWWEATNTAMRNNGEHFNVVQEMEGYCKQDVHLLHAGLVEYIKQRNADFPGLRIFSSITVSSLANRIFRAIFMPPKSVAMLPPRGFGGESHSLACLSWLYEQKMRLGLSLLRDARHNGEAWLLGRKIDGWGERPGSSPQSPSERFVFQFHGCTYHGCRNPSCRRSAVLWKGYEAGESDRRYEDTEEFTRRLLRVGSNPENPVGLFKVVTVWECEWLAERKEDPRLNSRMNLYMRSVNRTPLSPRDALYGGRVEVFRHHLDTKENPGVISDHDITSLYPYKMFNGRYPIGIPDVYISEVEMEHAPSMKESFVLVVADILPPGDLHLPVLPFRTPKKRLLFALCGRCAVESDSGPVGRCQHSDEDRVLRGTWVTEEVQEAIRQGYIVKKRRELWHFPNSSTTLFKGFMGTLFARKMEASGWPDDVRTDAERENLVRRYAEELGIHINFTAVKFNPAARTSHKLTINTGWGFLARNMRTHQHALVQNLDEIYDTVVDVDTEVTDLRVLNESMVLMQWREKEERCARTGNVVLGAFVTALGRLHLLSHLNAIPNVRTSLLYCDTDSIIFFTPENAPAPDYAIDGFFGAMKDELDGGRGTLFSSTGPKAYRLQFQKPNGEMGDIQRNKGFTLSAAAAEVITPDVITTLATQTPNQEPTPPIQVPQCHFVRKPFHLDAPIRTVPATKTYSFTDTKRIKNNHQFTTEAIGTKL